MPSALLQYTRARQRAGLASSLLEPVLDERAHALVVLAQAQQVKLLLSACAEHKTQRML